MVKNKKIEVKGKAITMFSNNSVDYISLTDMARYRDAERTNYIIQNWMRTRSAIEFCGLWEQLNNPDFKSIEFDAFKNQSGANSFTLTPQKWIEATNAIGIISKSGRYGGTFAHRDIAFEFATWISAEFKFYLINEFQRLKESEKEALARKKAEGVILGRPRGRKSTRTKLTGQEKKIKDLLEKKVSYSAIGRILKVHRLTVSSFAKRNNF